LREALALLSSLGAFGKSATRTASSASRDAPVAAFPHHFTIRARFEQFGCRTVLKAAQSGVRRDRLSAKLIETLARDRR